MQFKEFVLGVLALTSLTLAAPATNTSDDIVDVTEEFFADVFAIHKDDHDIINLLVPLNGINVNTYDDEIPVIFYTQADIKENGERTELGIYKLERNCSIKILDNGRDSAADLDDDDSKLVYLGGSDGIYVYDHDKNTTTKFGSMTEGIKQLVKINGTDKLYVLTDDNTVYEVLNQGTEKKEYTAAKGATDIVLDIQSKLYFVKDSKVFVCDGETKEVDIPKEGAKKLIRPPSLFEDGVLCLVGDQLYTVYRNGTSDKVEIVAHVKPTGVSIDSTLLQYYAYNKKIYQYNILQLLFEHMTDEMRQLLDEFKPELEEAGNKNPFNSSPANVPVQTLETNKV